MKAFGLCDRFIKFIQLCYIDGSNFININGSVWEPVTLSRGIKQGISSQLYIMSIEPLLMRMRNERTTFLKGLLYHRMAKLN